MEPNAAQFSLTAETNDEVNGGEYKHGFIQHSKNSYYEDNFPKKESMSFSPDITNLSFAKLTVGSDVLYDQPIPSNHSELFPLDTASTNAGIGSNFDFKDIDSNAISTTLAKGIKPKLKEKEKLVDIFGEYDEIDGFVFHSFTRMDRLEKFVARSERYKANNPALSHSRHSVKGKSYCRTSGPPFPDFLGEGTVRIDASFLILPEESYCENYEVPCLGKSNKRQMVNECKKQFCSMGCICDSLNSVKPQLSHCNHPECMCHIVCIYKSSLRRHILPISTENDTSRGFFEFDLLKKELDLQKQISHQLQLQLNSKRLEIHKLKNQFVENAIIKNAASPRPLAPKTNMASQSVKKVKAKVKAKVGAIVKTKGEAKMDRRRHIDGHYVDSVPFDEEVLDRLSESTTVTAFIRHIMRDMFTGDFLSSKSSRWMKEEHKAAIIEATMKRFQIYCRRNGDSIPVTVEMVKQVITSEFNIKQTKKKMRSKKRI